MTSAKRGRARESIGHIAESTKRNAKLYGAAIAVAASFLAAIGTYIDNFATRRIARDAQYSAEQQTKPIDDIEFGTAKGYRILAARVKRLSQEVVKLKQENLKLKKGKETTKSKVKESEEAIIKELKQDIPATLIEAAGQKEVLNGTGGM